MASFIKPEIISLKNSEEFNEKWLQKTIEDDPSLLGLGDLEFRDTEKILVGGGRLDTILYDPEDKKRYEVEIQLGKTDESHIIRTIEYWDLERKRNPQYEHCAVIIAEDITSRFLNVISLFNGFIPLIAIQVKALKIDDKITIVFTKILDEMKFELLDEDKSQETTDRNYWEKKSTKESLKVIDELFKVCEGSTDGFNLNYTKHYIGLVKDGNSVNFLSFQPRKSGVVMNFRIEKSDEMDEKIEQSLLNILSYDKQWKYYRLKISKDEIVENTKLIAEMAAQAKKEYPYL